MSTVPGADFVTTKFQEQCGGGGISNISHINVEWEEKAGSTEQKHTEVLQKVKKVTMELQASDMALKERMDYIEEEVKHGLQAERMVREADMREIRELVGCEKLSLQDFVSSVKDLLVREDKAFEMPSSTSHTSELIMTRTATCEAHIQELQERLASEASLRERTCSALQASWEESFNHHQEVARERLERTERMLQSAGAERTERLQGAFDKALQEHHSSVRECISGLERLLHEFVDEHSKAQCAVRDDFIQLDHQIELRFAEERAAREACAMEMRDYTRGLTCDTPSEAAPYAAEMHAKLNAEASARSTAALDAVSEMLVSERKATENRLNSIKLNLTQDQEAREQRMQEANSKSLQDFLQKLELKLQREFQREQENRNSDILELRALIGADRNSYADVLSSVNEVITREKEARLQHARDLQNQLHSNIEEAQGIREGLGRALADRCAALEEQFGAVHDANHTSMLSKDVDQRLKGTTEKVQEQLRLQQERFESQLQIVKDGLAAACKDQLKVEKLSWEHQHEALRDLVTAERDQRERSLACLQALVQRGREDQLRLERQLRDRQLESARELAANDWAARSQLALQDLIHGEEEDKQRAERASNELGAARELVAAERGARERSYAALHELLKCENEAMKELIAQEREARQVSHSTLKDAFQRERDARERWVQNQQEDLARERSLREEGDKALMDSINESRDAHHQDQGAQTPDPVIQQRLDSLERTACIFDGLVRAEKAERTAEARRMWEALDSHAHDLLKKEKEMCASACVAHAALISSAPSPPAHQATIVQALPQVSHTTTTTTTQQGAVTPVSFRSRRNTQPNTQRSLSPRPGAEQQTRPLARCVTPVPVAVQVVDGTPPQGYRTVSQTVSQTPSAAMTPTAGPGPPPSLGPPGSASQRAISPTRMLSVPAAALQIFAAGTPQAAPPTPPHEPTAGPWWTMGAAAANRSPMPPHRSLSIDVPDPSGNKPRPF